jgi:BirA family biotin operon repressor/biotin-[acetyl-CoA-carboxylase] ligase
VTVRTSDVNGWTVHTYASLPSTQDYIKELAAEDFPEGTVMQALSQTKGRGRHGREWISPMGNLYMSVLLRPETTADKAGQLSFVAAVALSEAIDTILAPGHVKNLKWPNDILIDGKKAAGILLESDMAPDGRINAIIMGMGVNIHATPDIGIGLQSVSHEITVPVNKFRDTVLEKIQKHYSSWKKNGFAPVHKAWSKQAHGLGQSLKVLSGGREYIGIFNGIDETGQLLIESDSGPLKLSTADFIATN